jgi:hypothetical protein
MTISKVFVPKKQERTKGLLRLVNLKHQDFKVCCKRKHTFVLLFFENA